MLMAHNLQIPNHPWYTMTLYQILFLPYVGDGNSADIELLTSLCLQLRFIAAYIYPSLVHMYFCFLCIFFVYVIYNCLSYAY